MENLEVKQRDECVGFRSEATQSQLQISERFVRFVVMTAFIAVLAFEAWLLCQVFQLF
jgi:hypothetical protein